MYNIVAKVYAQAKQFHYVKVEIDGVYISGIKVCKSKRFDDQLWIQMPAYKQGKTWKRYIETADDSKFAQSIYAAIDAAARPKIYGDAAETKDIVLEDIDDGPLDLSVIPF